MNTSQAAVLNLRRAITLDMMAMFMRGTLAGSGG
jgi:hypothetical protein